MAGGAAEEDDYCSDYDSDVGEEYYLGHHQRTDDFVSATAASLEEGLCQMTFQKILLEHKK